MAASVARATKALAGPAAPAARRPSFRVATPAPLAKISAAITFSAAAGAPESAAPAGSAEIPATLSWLGDVNRNDATELSNLGADLMQRNQFAEGEAAFRAAIAINAGDPFTHANLGGLLLQQRRMIEAEASARTAIGLNAKYALAWRVLAIALLDQGRQAEAQDAAGHVIRLEPKCPSAVLLMQNVVGRANLIEAIENASSAKPVPARASEAQQQELTAQDQAAQLYATTTSQTFAAPQDTAEAATSAAKAGWRWLAADAVSLG